MVASSTGVRRKSTSYAGGGSWSPDPKTRGKKRETRRRRVRRRGRLRRPRRLPAEVMTIKEPRWCGKIWFKNQKKIGAIGAAVAAFMDAHDNVRFMSDPDGAFTALKKAEDAINDAVAAWEVSKKGVGDRERESPREL